MDGYIQRPCKAINKTFYFVYPNPAIFVPDTEKCPYLWFIHLRKKLKKSFILKGGLLDFIREEKSMIAMNKVHSIRQLFYEQGKSVSAIAAGSIYALVTGTASGMPAAQEGLI